MSREILFKAKRVDNGEWEEGFVARPCRSDAEKTPLTYYFNAVDKLGWYGEVIISAETICQYTGLTDKNGRKIWEGDIVKTNRGRICKVVWFSSYCHQGYDLQPLESKNPPPTKWNLWTDLEVIGNIFDNPEWG